MMRRTRRLAPLALAGLPVLAAALLGGCQDYNFSPVNYSLIQPGTVRVTLADISTADLLFVVDDSGSMGGEQQKLAQSFDAFVTVLKDTNTARVDAGLEPIDFHIAVTTTSVFINQPTTSTCQAGCTGVTGLACCDSGHRVLQAERTCTSLGSTAQCGQGNSCRDDCLGRTGELMCCNGPGTFPEQAVQTCTTLGEPCGKLQTRYGSTRVPAQCFTLNSTAECPDGSFCNRGCPKMGGALACCDAAGLAPVCDIGVGKIGDLYPRGDFVRAGSNPRVIHFDKDLFCTRVPNTATADPNDLTCGDNLRDDTAIAALIQQFKQNVAVGTCGSGQEQPLEAAKRAIQKAQAGQQPGVAAGEWLHTKRLQDGSVVPSSKLVVVFVGDEDDCSSPEDPVNGLVFTSESCASDGTRRFPTSDYAAFLTSLDRPVAAGFIVSATSETCVDGDCNPGLCCDTACTGDPFTCTVGDLCGGQGEGVRLLALSNTLTSSFKLERVVGSICNPGSSGSPGFSSILARVAEVVKQPKGLSLPTVPALARLTVLRIVDSAGTILKTCAGPAPAGTTGAALDGWDWWFTAGDDLDPTPTGVSKTIFLNTEAGRCVADPGQTYSASYVGQVPVGGCADAPECASQLGGAVESWRCCVDVEADGSCVCTAGDADPACPSRSTSPGNGTCLVVPK